MQTASIYFYIFRYALGRVALVKHKLLGNK